MDWWFLAITIVGVAAAVVTIAEFATKSSRSIVRRVLKREESQPRLLLPDNLERLNKETFRLNVSLSDILNDTNVVVGANDQLRHTMKLIMAYSDSGRGDSEYAKRLAEEFIGKHPGSRINIVPEGWDEDPRLGRRNMVVVGGPRSNFTTMMMNTRLPITYGAVTHPRIAATRALIARRDSKPVRDTTRHFGPFLAHNGDAVIEVVRNPLDRGGRTSAIIVMGLYGVGTRGALYALFNDDLRQYIGRRMSERLVKFIWLRVQLADQDYVLDFEGEKMHVPVRAIRYP